MVEYEVKLQLCMRILLSRRIFGRKTHEGRISGTVNDSVVQVITVVNSLKFD